MRTRGFSLCLPSGNLSLFFSLIVTKSSDLCHSFGILYFESVLIFHHLLNFFSGGGGVVVYADVGSNHAIASEPQQPVPSKKKVVVLGTGWAGTSFVKNLDSSLYDVQIISPRNYFAFTPLLPSVTCGGVDARSVVEPIRKIMQKVIILFCYLIRIKFLRWITSPELRSIFLLFE